VVFRVPNETHWVPSQKVRTVGVAEVLAKSWYGVRKVGQAVPAAAQLTAEGPVTALV
jgi:hypothetical protein